MQNAKAATRRNLPTVTRLAIVSSLSDHRSEASLKLEEHVNGVTSLHVNVGNRVLVSERLSTVDQSDHGDVNSLLLLQSLLDLENVVSGLEVERLLHSCEGL